MTGFVVTVPSQLLLVVLVVGIVWAVAWAVVQCKRIDGPAPDHTDDILHGLREPTWTTEVRPRQRGQQQVGREPFPTADRNTPEQPPSAVKES